MNILSRMMGGFRPSFQSDIPIAENDSSTKSVAALNGPLIAIIGREGKIIKPLCKQLAAFGCAIIVFSDPDAYLEYLLASPKAQITSVFVVQELYGYAALQPHELAEHSKVLRPHARVSVVSDMQKHDAISNGISKGVDCLLKAPTSSLAVISALGLQTAQA